MALFNATDLVASARSWRSRAAADAFGDRVSESLALAGISLEHLCKAYLVSIDAALIVEPGPAGFETLLHIHSMGHLAKTSPKTIGALQAWERVQRMANLTADANLIKKLIDIRNGSLHSGLLSGGIADQVFLEFATVSEQLEKVLAPGRSAEDIWGIYLDKLTRQREADESTRRSDVAARVAKADELARQVFKGVLPGSHAMKRLSLQAENLELLSLPGDPYRDWRFGPDINVTEVQRFRCPVPACGDDGALLLGWIDRSKDPGSKPLFFATQFRCGVCQLHLPTLLHVRTTGLPTHFEV